MRETGRRRRAEGVAEAAASARRVGKVAAMRETEDGNGSDCC
jgi:hypothetical protein